jgi:hypothetical protein
MEPGPFESATKASTVHPAQAVPLTEVGDAEEICG